MTRVIAVHLQADRACYLAAMKILHCDQFAYPLPEGHRFPAIKYTLLRERVEAELVPPCELLVPDAASDEALLRVHHPEYLGKVICGTLTGREMRRIGLPWSPELVERSRRSVGGTIAACRSALADGLAINLSGGTHHAFPDHGAGYCIFNDIAVAIRAMQAEGRARRIVVVDCDVHQGDGTAAIFAGDSSVFTFSIHGAKNFPLHKERSDLDVELPDGTPDADYLDALEIGLERSLALACADLAIYLAGADPFMGDTLGRLALTKEGLAARDRLVFDQCRSAGLPVAVVMGGGYAKDIRDAVEIQLETVRIAAKRMVTSQGVR
jgi:acetoin utilization deacetylase AcuC-like enzyme